MMIDPHIFWFLLAVIMVAMEVVLGMTVVLLSASLAAFVVGAAIASQLISAQAIAWQTALFFGMTALWCLILWRPMQKLLGRPSHKQPAYSNIIGQTVLVPEVLTKGEIGNVEWSGSIFKAQIDPNCAIAQIDEKKHATIVAVKNNVLIIKNI